MAPAYASGGYYADGKTPDDLAAEVRGYVDMGFTAVKIKVGGVSTAKDAVRIAGGKPSAPACSSSTPTTLGATRRARSGLCGVGGVGPLDRGAADARRHGRARPGRGRGGDAGRHRRRRWDFLQLVDRRRKTPGSAADRVAPHRGGPRPRRRSPLARRPACTSWRRPPTPRGWVLHRPSSTSAACSPPPSRSFGVALPSGPGLDLERRRVALFDRRWADPARPGRFAVLPASAIRRKVSRSAVRPGQRFSRPCPGDAKRDKARIGWTPGTCPCGSLRRMMRVRSSDSSRRNAAMATSCAVGAARRAGRACARATRRRATRPTAWQVASGRSRTRNSPENSRSFGRSGVSRPSDWIRHPTRGSSRLPPCGAGAADLRTRKSLRYANAGRTSPGCARRHRRVTRSVVSTNHSSGLTAGGGSSSRAWTTNSRSARRRASSSPTRGVCGGITETVCPWRRIAGLAAAHDLAVAPHSSPTSPHPTARLADRARAPRRAATPNAAWVV